MTARLVRAALGAAAMLAATTAFAQDCTAPPTVAVPLTPATVLQAGSNAIARFQEEQRLSGKQRENARARRVSEFRRAAQINWRYFCDFRAEITGDAVAHARALTRGVLFFDMADDQPRARLWLRSAKPRVAALPGPMPVFAKQPLDVILGVATARLSSKASAAQESWYFRIDKRA
ncbi:MAG TPA: hypothetical protein VF603_10505 [Allosphingosinicella sp.]